MSTKVLFVEYLADAIGLDSNELTDSQVVALYPGAAAGLEIQNVAYKVPYLHYYDRDEYLQMADERVSSFYKMVKKLDDLFLETCPQETGYEIAPFFTLSYLLRFSWDVINVRLFEFRKVVEHCNPRELVIFANQGKNNETDALFSDNISLSKEVLELLAPSLGVEFKTLPSKKKIEEKKKTSSRNLKVKLLIKKIVRIMGIKLIYFFGIGVKGKILSVGSREVRTLIIPLMLRGWKCLHWSFGETPEKEVEKKADFVDRFIKKLDKDNEAQKHFVFSGVSFYPIIRCKIISLLKRSETFPEKILKLEKQVEKLNPSVVIFDNHSSHEEVNVLLPRVLDKKNIPYACWMHGGYGAYKRNPGFEASDFLFTKNYLVYGEKVKAMIDATYPELAINQFIVGSPLQLKKYQNYSPPKNNKKVVVYSFGAWQSNSFLIGEDQPDNRFSFWPHVKKSIEILANFSDQYRVVLRVGSDPIQIELIEYYLEARKFNNIEISYSLSSAYEDLLQSADLLVFSWISTTIWEGALTHADIFLYDPSPKTKDVVEALKGRAYIYENLEEYENKLTEYLSEGNFYKKNTDTRFLNEYLDLEGSAQIIHNFESKIRKVMHGIS